MEIQEIVKATYCATMNWNPGEIQYEDVLHERADWDSVNQLRVLMALEATLGMKLPIKKYAACTRISEVAELAARTKNSV